MRHRARALGYGSRAYARGEVPLVPGRYELRVVMTDPDTVPAAQPIEVGAAQASIRGPASAAAGSTVAVEATGPTVSGRWVGFAPAGSADAAYLDYRHVDAATTAYSLTAPEQPGDYELRYVAGESVVVARQAIRIDRACGVRPPTFDGCRGRRSAIDACYVADLRP